MVRFKRSENIMNTPPTMAAGPTHRITAETFISSSPSSNSLNVCAPTITGGRHGIVTKGVTERPSEEFVVY